MFHQAYIGIGSNLGDRLMFCRQAIELLKEQVQVTRASACYETDPMAGTEGGSFLNGIVEIRTDKAPRELLTILQSIETKLGRTRTKKWGERTIDLDLLLFEDQVIDTPELKIPHPELSNRRFVLKPLADLAPDLVHPVLGRTIQQLVGVCADQGKVTRYGNFY